MYVYNNDEGNFRD